MAAKGAVESLTRQWATEWAKHGIRVNGIRPTFVDTPQVAMLLDDPAFKAGIVGRIPLGLRNAGSHALRYNAQANGYLLLLTDRYPFSGPPVEEPLAPTLFDAWA